MQSDNNIKKVRTISGNRDYLFIKYMNQKRNIAAGYMDGSVVLYNAKNLEQECLLCDLDTKNINNATTCITDDNKRNNLLTCSYSGGLIKIWDFQTGHCVKTLREKRQICGIKYHPKVSKLYSYGDDGNIFLYDIESEKLEFIYQKSDKNSLDGHMTKVFSLTFNPVMANEFLTGGWDNIVYYWDARCQYAVRKISDVFICGDGISINRLGKELITCEWKRDDPIKLWDYQTTKLLEVIKPDADVSHLYCGKYVSDNYVAVGGSDNHLYRLINLRTLSTFSYVKGLAAGVYCLDTMENKKPVVNKFEDIAELPIISFCSGKTLYEVRYR